MLNRLTVSALLKTVILTTALCVGASETLETQSRQLGTQVTHFLGKIRAA